MKRLTILSLAAAGLLLGACGGADEETTSGDVAREACGTDEVTWVFGAEQSGYNGKGPAYDNYTTGDGRKVTVFQYGDGTWGTTYSGECE